jgi:hypothetical protein
MNKNFLEKSFEPEFFNDSDLNKLLSAHEKAIMIIDDDETEVNKLFYDSFFNKLSECISKFNNSIIKKLVLDLYSRRKILLGVSDTDKVDPIFSRLFIDIPSISLYGVSIDLYRFNFDINKMINDKKVAIDYSTNFINKLSNKDMNNIIYILYYSLIRASILLNHKSIFSNTKLHINLINYFKFLTIKSIGNRILISEQQKKLVHFACAYLYFKQFLNYKHIQAISAVRTILSDILEKDFISENSNIINIISKYDDIKDMGKILIDLKVININPNQVIMNMYKVLTPVGFFGLSSTLDILITMCILSKYPTDLYDKSTYTIDSIHNVVEDEIIPLIKKIKYKD